MQERCRLLPATIPWGPKADGGDNQYQGGGLHGRRCRNDVDYFQQRSRGGRRRMEETISITAVGAMAADAVIERYRIRQTTDAMEWNELFARVTHPNLYQSWAFGEAKR